MGMGLLFNVFFCVTKTGLNWYYTNLSLRTLTNFVDCRL